MLWELAARNCSPKCHKELHEKLLGLLFQFFPFIFWLWLSITVGNSWIKGEPAWTMCLHQHHPAQSSSCPILLPSTPASSRGGISESHRDHFKMQSSLI